MADFVKIRGKLVNVELVEEIIYYPGNQSCGLRFVSGAVTEVGMSRDEVLETLQPSPPPSPPSPWDVVLQQS